MFIPRHTQQLTPKNNEGMLITIKKAVSLILCVVFCFSLSACGKSDEVKAVEHAISSIGTVELDNEKAILAAEDMFDSLSDEEKEQVDNYDALTDARAEYNSLLIDRVETLIDDIGTVTSDSGEQIEKARQEYEALPKALQNDVENLDVLISAETQLSKLKFDDILIDYKYISAYKVNLFDFSTDEWYEDNDISATLFILFYVQGDIDGTIDFDKMSLAQYVAINAEDDRVDIYGRYDDGVLGIQYWPDKEKAQFGTVKTDLSITDYLDLLVEGEIIDNYRAIPFSNISDMINLMLKYV